MIGFHVSRRGSLAAIVVALTLGACAPQPGGPGAGRGPDAAATPTAAPGVDPAGPVRVALLVPLGNPDHAALGQSLVNAAELARGDLQGIAIDLRVYETAGDAAQAGAAATRAVAEGAAIILGPLFGTEVPAVRAAAAPRGIKVLSFSTTPSAAGNGVWLIGQTAESEAQRILGYARSQGIGSIGLFYPQSPSGEAAAAAVRAAAGRLGVEVTAALDYPRSFQGIQDRAKEYAEIHSAPAVLLPEGGQGLRSAGAFLSYFGVRPGETRYLGLGQWNAPVTIQEAALHGGWFPAPDPDLFAAFAARYTAAYQQPPAAIASLGYDGVAAIGAMIRDARAAGSRDPFAEPALTDPSGFAGVGGAFRLRADGLNDRALAVMEVGADGFRVVDPAPRSPSPGS